MALTLQKALRPISSTYKTRIRSEYGRHAKFDKAALELAIFTVQNELEHNSPKNPQVQIMNDVRNVLLDELGVNSTHLHLHYPSVERTRAIMFEKRRKGPAVLPAGFGKKR